MITYLFKQTLGAIPTLALLLTLTFFLLRLAPGGPFDSERAWPPEIKANIDRQYELDRPVYVQFGHWAGSAVRGDFRESFQYTGIPVSQLIKDSLPVSMTLGFWAVIASVIFGLGLGAIAAWKQNTWIDGSAMFLAIAGVSLPSYLVASVLILSLSLGLGWFPPALWEGPSSLVLPVITLALRPLAIIARLTRASMLEAMNSDYIRTAFSKGLSERSVVFKHALKNSLIPILTVVGPITAYLVTGSFLVETVFQIPGIGKFFVEGILNRDYPLVMGVTLVYGVILIAANLGVDLLYGVVDPRIRLGEKSA